MKFSMFILAICLSTGANALESINLVQEDFPGDKATEKFEVWAENGYIGDCLSVLRSENKLTLSSHLERIVTTAKKAQENCQVETGRLCGIVTFEGREKNGTDYTGSTVSGCFAYALARPF